METVELGDIPGPVLERSGRTVNPRDEADHVPRLPGPEPGLRAGLDQGFRKGIGDYEAAQSEWRETGVMTLR